MSERLSALRPSWSGLVLYCVALVGAVFTLLAGGHYALLALPLLLVVYHGRHETFHNTLLSSERLSPNVGRIFNNILGVLGCAVLAQNYYLLRWSHGTHHEEDGKERSFASEEGGKHRNRGRGFLRIMHLLGLSYHYHTLGGAYYLFLPFGPSVFKRRFKPYRYNGWVFVITQILIMVVAGFLFSRAGWDYLLLLIAVGLYQGGVQDVVHYNPGVSEDNLYTAKSYRVGRALEFLTFRSSFYHLEHHAFPAVPGLSLSDPGINEELATQYGIVVVPRLGLGTYLRDVCQQFKSAW